LAVELPLLVNRCLAGHQPSFGELIQRFRGQVYGLCYRMLGQREDAEDATQETFVRVVRNLHRWDPERAFEPWLLTIAGNRCRTRLAKRMRRPGTMSLDYPIEDQSVEIGRGKLLAEEMEHVLGSVRKEYREAFLLFHKQELCYNEISETLGVPLGTVKTWVHRARRELIMKLRKRGVLSG
jgi:RNA polymerase sigma-70 factor (ECF subfamily)